MDYYDENYINYFNEDVLNIIENKKFKLLKQVYNYEINRDIKWIKLILKK